MTVGVTQAMRVGASAVACASTGNTGASMAAYAALAGIPALVFVPAGKVAMGKLTQSLAYGARTLVVRGDFDECLRVARRAASELGVYLLNSVNPYRIEGQKTIVLEMLEQCGWDAPDWIALPAGNLGNTAAFGKALPRHAIADSSPRPATACRASRGRGAVRACVRCGFRGATTHQAEHGRHRDQHRRSGLVPSRGAVDSRDERRRDLRERQELLEAKAIIDAAGVGCEPASAASVAGVRRMMREGVISDDADVVCVLTGHVLKDPESTDRYHRATEPRRALSNPPVEIDATIDDLRRTLDRA